MPRGGTNQDGIPLGIVPLFEAIGKYFWSGPQSLDSRVSCSVLALLACLCGRPEEATVLKMLVLTNTGPPKFKVTTISPPLFESMTYRSTLLLGVLSSRES